MKNYLPILILVGIIIVVVLIIRGSNKGKSYENRILDNPDRYVSTSSSDTGSTSTSNTGSSPCSPEMQGANYYDWLCK